MLSLLVTLQDCGTLPFKRTPTPTEYAMTYTLTEKGMTKFIGCGVNNAMFFASQLPIPPLEFNLSLGITTMYMKISDIHFVELTTQQVAALIHEGSPTITAELINAYVGLSMSWYFRQDSYPFLSDNGTGVITLEGINFTATVGAGLDTECPGHFKIEIPYARLIFSKLRIHLEGGQSWIYESLIDLIIDALEDDISEVISQVIEIAIEQMFTSAMMENGYYLELLTNDAVIKDARFIDGWKIGNHALTIVYSGYTYLMDDLEDEYMTADKLSQYQFGKYNNDIVFGIHEEGFNNNFYIFHKYFNTFSSEDILVTEPPKVVIENIAFRVILQVSLNDSQYTVELKGLPVIKMVGYTDPDSGQSNNVTLITLKTECADVREHNVVIDDPEVCDMVSQQFNRLNPNAPYEISNTPFMNMEEFDYLFDSQERVLRLLGSVPEECEDFM